MRQAHRVPVIVTVLLCAVLTVGCAAPRGPEQPAPIPLSQAISNSSDVVASIRAGMRDYAAGITIRFEFDSDILNELSALTDEWVEAALQETDDPREGDYIRYQYGGYESTCSYEIKNGQYFYTVEIIPDYYLYYIQEQEASEKLAEAYAELGISDDASDYEKIRTIYDYVCTHVKYDEIHRKNPYYHTKSTIYAALVNHTATCQGYCVLLYRMLRENGIDCRVVTGTGADGTGEQLHAWNIVALDGQYYHLDATWDAGTEEYRYFLRGSEGFENHAEGSEFRSAGFISSYPISALDYQK